MKCSRRVLAIALVLVSMRALPSDFSSRECGVSFSLPEGWTAQIEMLPWLEVEGVQCWIAVQPEGWTARVEASRWGMPDHPLWLAIFPPKTRFKKALQIFGFEEDEYWDGLGVHGIQSTFYPAENYAIGSWKGLIGESFFRRYIRSHDLLQDESPVYSGADASIVLRSRRRVIGFKVLGGSPDESVDCDPALKRIVETLELRRPGPIGTP